MVVTGRKSMILFSRLNRVITYATALSYIKYRSASGINAPITPDQQTLDHERRPDESVLCTDIFHDRDLLSSDGNTHGDRIADQENGYRKKDRNNRNGYISHQTIHACQSLCHHIRAVDVPDALQPFREFYNV